MESAKTLYHFDATKQSLPNFDWVSFLKRQGTTVVCRFRSRNQLAVHSLHFYKFYCPFDRWTHRYRGYQLVGACLASPHKRLYPDLTAVDSCREHDQKSLDKLNSKLVHFRKGPKRFLFTKQFFLFS